MPADVRHISDTAKWVAAYRALETERRQPIFRDPYASRLAGETGRRLAREMPGGNGNAWSLIARTKVLDDLVERLIREARVDRVVNLAAGFDTRPYRLELPAGLRWIEVDLPPVLDEKAALLADASPRCALERLPCDLSDRAARQAVFARAGAEGRVLVITEGLLIYLEPAQVAELARDLAAVPTFQLWAMDVVNHRILRVLRRQWGKELVAGNSEMKFGPEERLKFFEPHGWHELWSVSLLTEAVRLGRPPLFGRLINLALKLPMPTAQRQDLPWGGVALLGRAGE